MLEHGDLLLVRGSTRELIDVTVARPTTLTLLHGSASGGAHMQPLVATAQAEKRKHAQYDAECARHGWKMVSFAMESLGAKGAEAAQLLLRMASHSLDKSLASLRFSQLLSSLAQTLDLNDIDKATSIPFAFATHNNNRKNATLACLDVPALAVISLVRNAEALA